MRTFTNEEFEIMIYELTEKEPMCFDMLCSIAERFLRPLVSKWCYTDETLRSRQAEDDIMQDIFVRLIKTCVTGFLMREDMNGEINRDPVGFCKWMCTVARNIKRDASKAQQSRDFKNTALDDNLVAPMMFEEIDADRRAAVSKTFDIVLGSDRKPHIILSWLSQSLLILSYDLTKIEAIRFIEENMSGMTLFAIRDEVTRMFDLIPWLGMTGEQSARIEKALNDTSQGTPEGSNQLKYYYKNRGGKAAISDWIYRVNSTIKAAMDYEPFDN